MYAYCYIDSDTANALTDVPSDFEKIQLDFPQLREYLDKLFEDKAAIPARQYNFYIIIRTKICCLQQDLVNTIKSLQLTTVQKNQNQINSDEANRQLNNELQTIILELLTTYCS